MRHHTRRGGAGADRAHQPWAPYVLRLLTSPGPSSILWQEMRQQMLHGEGRAGDNIRSFMASVRKVRVCA